LEMSMIKGIVNDGVWWKEEREEGREEDWLLYFFMSLIFVVFFYHEIFACLESFYLNINKPKMWRKDVNFIEWYKYLSKFYQQLEKRFIVIMKYTEVINQNWCFFIILVALA
jgi:hypothetical protein